MFFRSLVRPARAGLVQQKRRFAAGPVGTWPKTIEAFPKKGYAEGGHLAGPQKEGDVFKIWVNQPGAWPIMVITAAALVFASYKVLYVDATAPEVNFSPSNRRTFNYLENDISPERNRILFAPSK